MRGIAKRVFTADAAAQQRGKGHRVLDADWAGRTRPAAYRLITMRSNDQFNTTIYGYSDRLRGIEGTRDVLLINPDDMQRANLTEGQVVSLISDGEDGIHRDISGLKVTPFSLPDGRIGAYYRMQLSHYDLVSKTPAKSVPVRIRAA